MPIPLLVRAAVLSLTMLLLVGCREPDPRADHAPTNTNNQQGEQAMSTTNTTATNASALVDQVKREGDRVWVEGVEPLSWNTWNTYMASLTNVARAMGDDVSYEEVMGLSGAAFRLHFHQPEWCPSSPDAGVGHNCEPLAHRALGYVIQHVDNGKDKAQQEALRKAVAASIDAGKPVIAIDLILVPDWGVIAGYVEDSDKFLCRTFHKETGGYDENEKRPWSVHIVKERVQPPARRQAVLDSFRAAVKLAETKSFGKYASGYAAYQAWANDLEKDDRFTGEALAAKPGSLAHISGWVHHSLVDARRAAVTYLRSSADEFEGPAREQVLAAADHYEKVVEALTPVDQYAHHLHGLMQGRKWTGEMRHAQAAALRKACEIERTAIAAIKQAIVEATVKREGDRVFIADVPKPTGSVSSLAVLTAALQQRGEDVDYTDLMGISGRAFRLQFSWCPSSPHAYIGYDCFEPAVAAMGYESTQLAGTFDRLKRADGKATPEQQEHTRAVVKAEIDAGRSVIFGSEEDALLVGYEPISDDNPTGWLRRPGPHGGGKKYMRPIKNMPWGLCALEKVAEPKPRRQAAINAMRVAILNAERGTVQDSELKTGFAAWEKWIKELEPAAFKAMVDDTRRQLKELGREKEDPVWGMCLGNAWIYQNLREARREAATYLRRVAGDLPESARPHVLAAADAYEKVADVLEQKGADEGAPCPFEYVPYPFRLKNVAEEWTDQMRAQQAIWLKNALPHERKAIAELSKALVEATTVGRDGGRVWIEDVPKPAGSVSSLAVLTAALQQRGEDVDYTYLMGVGGRAFRLQVNWCGSGPHAHFGIDCYTPAVEAMGYERVKLPGMHDVSKKPWVDATAEQQEHTRAVVKAEIDAGRTICFSTGEDALLVGYEPISDDNPTGWLRRPGPHGGGKKYMRPIKQMPWALDALKRVSDRVSTREAAINAIRMAIKNTEGSGVDDENLKTGFAAWQSWIDELEPDGFKAATERVRKQMAEQGNEDADPLPGMCNGNAWIHENLAEARQEAAKYLRRIAPDMPEPARPHLLAAADSYERVVKAMSNDDVEGEPCAYEFVPYAFRLKDVAKEWTDEHRALQRKTLIAALPHERQAIAELRKALLMSQVKQEDGKVWIDIPGFSPGDFTSSIHGAQARILEHVGQSMTYDDLVGYGAFAFRTNWHKTGCPSGGHPCCGYMCIDGSNRAIPWNVKAYEAMPRGKKRSDEELEAFKAQTNAAIKASIDRGIPVQYDLEEAGLIIGYADDGKRWWCVHPYHKWGKEAFWFDEVKGMAGGKWPWVIVVWSEPKPDDQRADPRELTIAALKQVVDMWNTQKKGDYFCGDAAYKHWIQWLRDVEAGKIKNPKGWMQGNGWCYDVITQNRPIAARWLKKQAGLFDGEAKQHLLKAAKTYAKIDPVMVEADKCPWDLTLGPGRFNEWTSEKRQTQISRMEQARELDRAAIAEITKALEAVDEE
jgi:hypothetical protein